MAKMPDSGSASGATPDADRSPIASGRDRLRLAGTGPVGILAGGGALPLDVAKAVSAQGRAVHIIAIEGHADADVAAYPHEWINMGRIGRMLASFREAGCREMVIAGAIERPNLLRLRIDSGFVRQLPTLLAMTRGGDDSVLRRVVRFFELKGFVVRGAGELAPDLMASPGPLGMHRPSGHHLQAIGRAGRLIRALGPFDVGQGAVVTAEQVIAIEGVRGTDAMLADLGPGGCGVGLGAGAVLVKLAKPGQEMRVDLPTIGPTTLERAAAAGLAGIAVGAGSGIVLDRAALTARADAAGLFVTGVEITLESAQQISVSSSRPAAPLVLLSRKAPTPSDRRDLLVVRRLLPILAAEGAGHATVVAGEHVVAVSGVLPVEKLIAPLAARSLWGLRALRGRTGTLGLDLAAITPADARAKHLGIELFRAAKEARLAGIAIFGAAIPEAARADAIALANEAGLFLMSEVP